MKNPKHSILKVSKELRLAFWKMQSTLKKHHFHPFKYTEVPFLPDDSQEVRLRFCQRIVQLTGENSEFINNLCWTEKASLSTGGIYRKTHLLVSTNPHRALRFSGRQILHVYDGILHRNIIGAVFYQHTFTVQRYQLLLENILADLLQNLSMKCF